VRAGAARVQAGPAAAGGAGSATTTGSLLQLADWWHSWGHPGGDGVDVGLLERGLLLAGGRRVRRLAGQRPRVKNVPGRPKTDKADAVWLAKVAERGRCRPSLVHPARSASAAI
jgi:hypothetical protein